MPTLTFALIITKMMKIVTLNEDLGPPSPTSVCVCFLCDIVIVICTPTVVLVVRCPFREEHLAVCQIFFLYTCHFGEDVPPPWRAIGGLSQQMLIGKVFESTFQILKNRISMATSLATRCKTP